jgi:hypothetical protein
MNQVQRPAEGGQESSFVHDTPALRWSDPVEAGSWLAQLREQTLDAIAAGEDATRAPHRRFFSRHEARRRIRAAEGAIKALLDAADRGLHSSKNV